MAKNTIKVNGTEIITCEEIEALRGTAKLIEEYQKLKTAKTEIETRTKQISAEVMALMMKNGIDVMRAGNYKVTIVTKKGIEGFDKDALKVDYPEIYKEYVKPAKTDFTYAFNVNAMNGKPAKVKGTTALVESIKEALAATETEA